MPEYLDLIVRSFIFLFMLFIMTKLVGKKQLAELSFFEYVSGITIGSIAGEVIMGLENNILHGITAIVIFGTTTYLVDVLSIKSKTFRDIIDGKATVLIKDGKVLEENMKKEKYSIDELSSLLREKNVFTFTDVEFAVLEPKGELSVLLKKEKQALTPKDIGLETATEKETITVLMDGSILDKALLESGKSKAWLQEEMAKRGLSTKDVFMAQVDSNGCLHIDLYNDQLKDK
ncbi:DUF421 domain-containing protein [Mesobacillus zeae]|uniref:DUF421 domain-containing protein n=1 Tax=Mesobacillus zeae TaxID=1917180 RepID=A0A398BLQ7_9BACI|nr:DUF421 domain-containing protein [Mesobacillus zeae]RID88346.1 DUF421 domain-containing protein [Mesobacillus zeae]